MKFVTKIFFSFLIATSFASCTSKNVVGVYKWPCDCFDAECISLNKDSTFFYVNLLFSSEPIISGKYKISKNKISFHPNPSPLFSRKITDTILTSKIVEEKERLALYAFQRTMNLEKGIFKFKKGKIYWYRLKAKKKEFKKSLK
jgi:hypothetical protein